VTAMPGAGVSQSLTSRDGTPIAYSVVGRGPNVILVDGALCFRGFGPMPELAKLLASHVTVYHHDRRGRGESGNAAPIRLEREIEDIEALIDTAGGTAGLFGISSGGALALEAATTLGNKVGKLALYEIPYDDSEDGVRRWREYRTALRRCVDEGRGGDATELFMRFVGASDEGVSGMRRSPVWPTFEAVGPTLLYDAEALGSHRTVPSARAAQVLADTLVMDGANSREHMPFMRASADELARVMPNATRRTLEGQAHDVDVNVLAPILADFFAG
jgi:pimeloyl-ACP methyl ester carboxylesterase